VFLPCSSLCLLSLISCSHLDLVLFPFTFMLKDFSMILSLFLKCAHSLILLFCYLPMYVYLNSLQYFCFLFSFYCFLIISSSTSST
jgi:hypothetical protein